MKRTTAQRILSASGILALVGGGSCFLALNSGAALIGLAGIAALLFAVILCIIGLIGLIFSRREDTYRDGLRLKEKGQHLPDSDENLGQSQGKEL